MIRKHSTWLDVDHLQVRTLAGAVTFLAAPSVWWQAFIVGDHIALAVYLAVSLKTCLDVKKRSQSLDEQLLDVMIKLQSNVGFFFSAFFFLFSHTVANFIKLKAL